MSTGELIKQAIKGAGLSQEKLAQRLDVSLQSVRNWISDTHDLKLSTVKKIAAATGKPTSFFLGEEHPPRVTCASRRRKP